MTMPDFSSPKAWGVIVGAGLVIGGGVFDLTHRSKSEESPTGLPASLSVASLKAQVSEPAKLQDTIREAVRREDLTEEQRRELFQNMRRVWRDTIHERIEEYFQADPEDQVAILDQQIDQFQEQMKAWQRRREQMQKERKRRGNADQRRRRMGQRSREQRKERSESRNPDDMARTMVYFAAVRQRMAERGIEMPGRGGGGGRGGRMGRRGP